MAEVKELQVSVVANQDSTLSNALGWLIQELEEQYIVVERDNGEYGVLCVADIAWLSYQETLSRLGQYIHSAHKVDANDLTADELTDFITQHSGEFILVFEGTEFKRLLLEPATIMGIDEEWHRACKRVKCRNCQRNVVLCDNRRRCPICGQD
ncbi:MAG: hypothetical protein JW981_03205, partial [Anaerolineae bacterium]|nr:hypothetical protein [Anaerolineae bacterium]